MEMPYVPKFSLSSKAVRLTMEIAAALERYKIVMEGPEGVRLRKLNHIRTIRGTTAIEGNTLTESEVTDVIAGRRVAGSKREIAEVKNAHRAYSSIAKMDPQSCKDLLKAHGIMTAGLVEGSGKWRKCNVCVFNSGGKVMHAAPNWDQVPFLMKDLFGWLRRSKDVPLIKSCVFHYAFETIHPFRDGNGRMGRLWQTAILGRWNELFYAAPVENMVFSHQKQYYRALHSSQMNEDATAFIDFMLEVILRTIKAKGELKVTGSGCQKRLSEKGCQKTAQRMLAMMKANPNASQSEIAAKLGISRQALQKHISKMKDAQRLRRVGPDKGGCWEVV